MSLFDIYPRPWKVVLDGSETRIVASNDNVLYDCPGYSGDGERLYLESEQLQELVEFINKS